MDRLAPDTLDRLVKLLGMLGSAHDGERAAAGLKAHELRRHGLTWSDILLAAPAPPPKLGWATSSPPAKRISTVSAAANARSSYSLARWRGTPTEKQLAWLYRIYENLP